MPYRPGITGAATLAFRREEEILSQVHPSKLNQFYDDWIKPLKARIDVRYMYRAIFWSDMRMIAATFMACVMTDRVATVNISVSSTFPDAPNELLANSASLVEWAAEEHDRFTVQGYDSYRVSVGLQGALYAMIREASRFG